MKAPVRIEPQIVRADETTAEKGVELATVQD